MKQLLLSIAAFLICQLSLAQIMNPGFEALDPVTGTPSNWRPTSFNIVIIDSSCVSMGQDSIFFATSDAHSGNHAAELRTAINCDFTYSGKMHQMRFQIDTFADQRVPFGLRPNAFTFFYKLLPVLGDGARVFIALEKENGFVVAGADTVIHGSTSAYRQAKIPLTYHSADTPEFVRMIFFLESDSVLHYGSRLLVDDINLIVTGVNRIQHGRTVNCYPIPAKEEINLNISGLQSGQKAVIRISDISGRLLRSEDVTFQNGKVQLDVKTLANGTYFLTTQISGQAYTVRFVK